MISQSGQRVWVAERGPVACGATEHAPTGGNDKIVDLPRAEHPADVLARSRWLCLPQVAGLQNPICDIVAIPLGQPNDAGQEMPVSAVTRLDVRRA
jgi:hypothetical protein